MISAQALIPYALQDWLGLDGKYVPAPQGP
jgi:hypothetical protein